MATSMDERKDLSPSDSEQSSVTGDIDTRPEPNWPKGWRPWTSLFGCFLLMWNSWGIVNAYGTFASYYRQHLQHEKSIMLWNLVGSTQCFVVLILSIVVGRICDAGNARVLIGVGGVMITASMFILSTVNGEGQNGDGNYEAIWAVQGVMQGLGMACFFVTSSQVAATWFTKRKATAIGIVASGASISGLVYPIATTFTIELVGFNNAVRIIAGIIGITCLLSFFLATSNPAHTHRKPETWLDSRVFIDKNAFTYQPFYWATASICCTFFGFYAVFFNLEAWAAHYGFGRRYSPPGLEVSIPDEKPLHETIDTFWLLAILNVSSTIGRLSAAWLSEKFGTLIVHSTAMTVGSLLVLVLWTQATTLAPALAFIIIFGAISGAIIGMPPASMAWVLEQGRPEDSNRLGQWVGMMYSCSAPFALTGPVIAGHLIQKYKYNFLTVQLWSGFSLLLAGVCMAMAFFTTDAGRTRVNRWKGSMSLSRATTVERGRSDAVARDLARKRAEGGC